MDINFLRSFKGKMIFNRITYYDTANKNQEFLRGNK